MEIAGLVLTIIGLVGKVFPPLGRWLGRKTNGYSEWKSEITYWAGLPRSVKGQFFGRDDELKKISDSLKQLNAVVLSGGPGIGKSKLAAEFAKKSKRRGFWTPGGETPDQTLLSLAPHLGIERGDRSDDEILVQTRRRLQALPAKTLWVIDSLSNLDHLNTLLNEIGKISILVTSQDSRTVVPQGVGYIPIDVLGSEPAIRLLCRSSNYDYRQPIFLEIVDEVGRLPRAVEALAVQLELPGETPETLLKELRGKANPLEFDRFQKQTAGLQIPRTDSLFNALRGPIDALPPEIREALAPLGYAADSPIPMPLAAVLTGLSGGALINFFDECSGKSVLSVVGEQVTIHSLTSAAIAATNPDGSLRATLQRATNRLANVFESGYMSLPFELDHHEWILAYAINTFNPEDPAVLGHINNLAAAFNSAGRYEDSVRLHDRNLEVMVQVLGSDHPDTLSCRNNLAAAHLSAGRYTDAAELHGQTLEAQERVLGPEHPDTMMSRSNLAAAYTNSGRNDDAIELHSQVLEARERISGPDHPDTLVSRSNLAATYGQIGRYEEAAQLLRQTLESQARILGAEHVNTLISRNNLAAIYGQAGLYVNAAKLLRENQEIQERILGTDHPDALTTLSNLANAIGGIGQHDEAARLHLQTLEGRKRVLGPDHPDTLSSRNNLAAEYGESGRYQESAQILKKTLGTLEKVLGIDHPDTLISRSNLAIAYRNLDRNAEADALIKKV